MDAARAFLSAAAALGDRAQVHGRLRDVGDAPARYHAGSGGRTAARAARHPLQAGRARHMKSYRQELSFNLPSRRGFVNITRQVEEALHESGIREGLCLVNPMHITASVFINDEDGLHRDYERWLEAIAPHEPVEQYHHNETGEDNADAHIKRQVMGREV